DITLGPVRDEPSELPRLIKLVVYLWNTRMMDAHHFESRFYGAAPWLVVSGHAWSSFLFFLASRRAFTRAAMVSVSTTSSLALAGSTGGVGGAVSTSVDCSLACRFRWRLAWAFLCPAFPPKGLPFFTAVATGARVAAV